MSKKIALLIGVSSYLTQNDIPACQKDIDLMSSIISSTEKYDDVLLLNESPNSNDAKERIATFIRENKNHDIEEVFVYFTGHGSRVSDDFLYLFSDFEASRKEQTSLRNSEFDSMLKSLDAKLTVKVVDACQAGTEYIKSEQDLQVIFKDSSDNSFSKAYFLFSSSSVEASIALDDYSVFTKSFALALSTFKGTDIRYRDIMAYISDDNSVKAHQTPLFIQQADNTEVFCSVSSSLIEIIRAALLEADDYSGNSEINANESNEVKPTLSHEELLIEAIRSKSTEFCDEKEAQESLSYLVDSFINYEWPKFITTLFSIEIQTQANSVALNSQTELAKWIEKSDEPYFVRITYREEEYQAKEKVVYEDKPPAFASIFGATRRVEYQPVTRYRDVIDGYELTAPSPSQTLMLSLTPKEQMLPWYRVFYTYIFSKSKLTLFFKCETEKETSWKNRELEENNKWKTMHCNLKNSKAIDTLVYDAVNEITQEISHELKVALGQE